MCVFAVTREILILPRKPELQKRCCVTIVRYIRQHYTSAADAGTLIVDAIVAPGTKGFIFAPIVAYELGLPFIPIRKAKKLLADPKDLFKETYKCRRNQVNLPYKIRHFFDSLVCVHSP